ncbi:MULTISPECIES: hypothetical protein [unclassified Clostridium]|uniref:hypothetical protein n=1 Tax=unclassified Clostridium TaxID=2614128 RepID=UPI000297AB95|nr:MULTISPECIES: hypothetical protein [unclassified Clostridium]EKQ56326.1 MAG: hypothetical protein A370_02082 [Clostridium sp. Maddingley MBC34-26]
MDNNFLNFKQQCLEKFMPETLNKMSQEIKEKIKNANPNEYKDLDPLEFQAYMITLVNKPTVFNSLMANINLLESYHAWLIENYDLTPKKK